MISFPSAKINIGLNILKKRADGFHEIESVFYPLKGLSDILEIIEAKEFDFSSSGLDIPGNVSGNLCVKAFELLKNDFNIPDVKIHLHKVIPMGAGLGGGSSDGAFVLNMLDELFGLGLSIATKKKYALNLGSDCPFFIQSLPAVAEGRGELLHSIQLDLRGFYVAVVNPQIHISTKEAYSGVVPSVSNKRITDFIFNAPINWKENIRNQFEESLFPHYPQIESLKSVLYDNGAVYASMTGSGSTVYGIFNNKPDLSDIDPSYFVWIGQL